MKNILYILIFLPIISFGQVRTKCADADRVVLICDTNIGICDTIGRNGRCVSGDVQTFHGGLYGFNYLKKIDRESLQDILDIRFFMVSKPLWKALGHDGLHALNNYLENKCTELGKECTRRQKKTFILRHELEILQCIASTGCRPWRQGCGGKKCLDEIIKKYRQ